MRTQHLKHIDAFTRIPFSGNPAGVVLDAKGLPDAEMQLIAREMNLSETAFVLPSSQNGADLRIRWFTPTDEVDLCGHATIASFHGLAEAGMRGMKKEGRYQFTIETRSGLLGITVDKSKTGNAVEFELPVPTFHHLENLTGELLTSLDMNDQDLPGSLPAVRESYAYIPIRSLERLHALRPSFTHLAKECRSLDVGGICVLTLDTVDAASAIHSRFFAPSLGVDEDPVTGSANGPLGLYLHSFVGDEPRSIPRQELSDGRIEYVGEQGDLLKRPGRVAIRLALEAGHVKRIWVAGHAVTVMDTTLSYEEKG